MSQLPSGRTSRVALAVAIAVIAGAPASEAAARPRITSLKVSLAGVGAYGPDYTVRVTTRLRVCAQKGRLVIRVREQNTGFDDPPTVVAERYRKFFLRQRASCQSFSVDWKLGDSFFGIGVYRLRFQAVDRDRVSSRSVFRKFETTD